jgi:hypothetical protein
MGSEKYSPDSDSKHPTVVQVHDERLLGMFKLKNSLRNCHVDPRIMGELAVTDQRR